MADNITDDTGFQIFGFEIKRKGRKEEKVEDYNESFVAPTNEDGAIEIERNATGGVVAGGVHAHLYKAEDAFKTQATLIQKYRKMAIFPEVDEAITNICNDAISDGENKAPVSIVLDHVKINNKELSEGIKKKIQEEFQTCLKMMNFNKEGYEIFRDWYVDSRLMYHVIVDQKKPQEGIKELRQINPINMKKIREVIKEQSTNGVEVVKDIKEYYLYTDIIETHQGASKPTSTVYKKELKIPPEAIINVTSGKLTEDRRHVIGYLHKAIKPLNDYVSMQNSAVIYRLTRAPERRVFYIDVGNLPKSKAEQYVRDMMNKYKNKVLYDASTGEVENQNRHMTMLEDFWLPRREGGKGTEITTLAAGQNLGEIEDILFFQRILNKALNIPLSRLEDGSTINFGRQADVLRDELNFSKFISRLRKRFSNVFNEFLSRQLILKNIVTEEDWKEIRENIQYDFLEDAYIAESKEAEILNSRIELLGSISEYIGTFYSKEWVRKNVLMQTDEDIEAIDKQIEEEKKEAEDDEDGDDPFGFGGGFGGNDDGPQQKPVPVVMAQPEADVEANKEAEKEQEADDKEAKEKDKEDEEEREDKRRESKERLNKKDEDKK